MRNAIIAAIIAILTIANFAPEAYAWVPCRSDVGGSYGQDSVFERGYPSWQRLYDAQHRRAYRAAPAYRRPVQCRVVIDYGTVRRVCY